MDAKYRWLYSFSDAQIVFPERFTLALLEDARAIAAANGAEFRVLTYHRAVPRAVRFALHGFLIRTKYHWNSNRRRS